MSSIRLFTLVAFAMVAGCSNEGDSDSSKLRAASLPGVYAGVFPCEGCPGIASTLWLRPDHTYFFRQHYAADDVHEAIDAYSLGRWSLSGDERTIELRGAGPRRQFAILDGGELLMLTDSELEHRLTRDLLAQEFSATIRLRGMMRTHNDSASFTECLTGLVTPVSKGREFTRFQHQYRSAGGSSDATFVELDGRFSWSGDGTPQLLTIEQFITVRVNGAC